MQIETILKNFGLSDKEIAVYLALIELGPSPVRGVAAKSKINRGTSYDILKNLMQQGLVTYYHKTAKQYFVAEPPEKLLTALEDKQENLEQVRAQIKDSLPELISLFEKEGGRPTVKFYEGPKGVKQIFEDVLEEASKTIDKEYYLYSSATSEHRKNVYDAMPDFSQKRIAKKISVKIISLGQGGKLAGMDERKWMPVESNNLKATHEIIYAGKVAHISLDNKANPVGVVIQNEEIYKAQKIIFEFNWSKI